MTDNIYALVSLVYIRSFVGENTNKGGKTKQQYISRIRRIRYFELQTTKLFITSQHIAGALSENIINGRFSQTFN